MGELATLIFPPIVWYSLLNTSCRTCNIEFLINFEYSISSLLSLFAKTTMIAAGYVFCIVGSVIIKQTSGNFPTFSLHKTFSPNSLQSNLFLLSPNVAKQPRKVLSAISQDVSASNVFMDVQLI